MSCNTDFVFDRDFDRPGIAVVVEDWEWSSDGAGVGAIFVLGEGVCAADWTTCDSEVSVTGCEDVVCLLLVNKVAFPRSTGVSLTWPHSVQDLLRTLIELGVLERTRRR